MLLLAGFALLALYRYNWTNTDTDSTNDGSSNGLNYADLRITPGSLVTRNPRSDQYKGFDIIKNNGGKIGEWENSYLVRISYSSAVPVTIPGEPDLTFTLNPNGHTFSHLAILKYGSNTINIDGTQVTINIPDIHSAVQTAGNRGCLHFGDPSGFDMGEGCSLEGWGSPNMFDKYKNAWENYGSKADCVTFGGDNFYDETFACANRFYIRMHDGSVSTNTPFSTVLMLSVAGNHDYQYLGNPDDCSKNPTLDKYLSFMAQDTFSSGIAWPTNFTKCPIAENDFAYTYGVYVIGKMGFITWNDAVNPNDGKVLSDLMSDTRTVLNAFHDLEKIYYVSHWNVPGDGAAVDGPTHFNKNFNQTGFNKPIYCIVNHVHRNCNPPDFDCKDKTYSILGGGGLDGGSTHAPCGDISQCGVSLIHSDKLIPSGANSNMAVAMDTCDKHREFINSKQINPFTSPLMEPDGTLDNVLGPARGVEIYHPLTKSDWLTVMSIDDSQWVSLVDRFGLKKSVDDETKYWASCNNLIDLGIICDTDKTLTDSYSINTKLSQGLPIENVGCVESSPDFGFEWRLFG